MITQWLHPGDVMISKLFSSPLRKCNLLSRNISRQWCFPTSRPWYTDIPKALRDHTAKLGTKFQSNMCYAEYDTVMVLSEIAELSGQTILCTAGNNECRAYTKKKNHTFLENVRNVFGKCIRKCYNLQVILFEQ